MFQRCAVESPWSGRSADSGKLTMGLFMMLVADQVTVDAVLRTVNALVDWACTDWALGPWS